jgi:hypothetical protein
MIHTPRSFAAPLLAAALLSTAAQAQDRVVRLPERDRPLAGTPTQVFAIGRADGAAHETFGIVAGVAFDASDNLYVLDRQAARIMVYDRTGRFIRQIGSQGEGPGELIVPLQLTVGGDGTVIVLDLGRPGYSLFRPDGTFLRNIMMENWTPALGGPGIGWHPRGGIVGTYRPPLGPPRPGTSVQTQNVMPLLFQPLAGGEPARLYNIPQSIRVEQQSNGGQFNVRVSPPPAFSPAVLFGVIPSGQMALSFTSGYTVRILDAGGQTVRYLQRPVRARLTTDADRQRAREERREALASGRGAIRIQRGGGGGGGGGGGRPAPGRSPQEMERILSEMEFADTIPALRGLRVAPSGKLWIERTGPVVSEAGPIDLVTPEGQYLGTISGTALPDAISRGGLAAYIERDDDDVERVVVRRLPEGWR